MLFNLILSLEFTPQMGSHFPSNIRWPWAASLGWHPTPAWRWPALREPLVVSGRGLPLPRARDNINKPKKGQYGEPNDTLAGKPLEKQVKWSLLEYLTLCNGCIDGGCCWCDSVYWILAMNPILDALWAESYFRLTHVRNPVVTL